MDFDVEVVDHMEEFSSYLPTNLAVGSNLVVSTVLGGIIVVLSLWHAVAPSFVDEGFALVPHHTVFTPTVYIPVPFMWNIVTAHLFEGHIVKFFLITPWVFKLARMLERLWSPAALASHLGFTALCAGFFVFIGELFIVYESPHNHSTFFKPVRGCVGLVVALAVGLRHAFPFEMLPLVPHSWGLQCQHLPFALSAFISTVGLLFPPAMPEWPFAPLALFFGWVYIRYLMWFPFAKAHGDHAPEFTFASLFPRPTRPLVSCAGSVAYSLAVLCAPGFVKLREADESLGHAIMYDPVQVSSDTGNGAIAPSLRLPGPSSISVAPATSQREYDARRAKALQLLDDNINALLASAPKKADVPTEVVWQASSSTNIEDGLELEDKDL